MNGQKGRQRAGGQGRRTRIPYKPPLATPRDDPLRPFLRRCCEIICYCRVCTCLRARPRARLHARAEQRNIDRRAPLRSSSPGVPVRSRTSYSVLLFCLCSLQPSTHSTASRRTPRSPLSTPVKRRLENGVRRGWGKRGRGAQHSTARHSTAQRRASRLAERERSGRSCSEKSGEKTKEQRKASGIKEVEEKHEKQL